MADFKKMKPEEFERSVFQMIGRDWMLVAAEKNGKVNTMTASWGGMGVMWGKNVVFVVIRPQRYTKEFVDASQTLSLSFLSNGYREKLNYLGTVSGRDEDKIAKTELTVAREGGTPYFEEADVAIIAKKLFAQPYDPSCFIDQTIDQQWYPQKDYHTLYIAEIEEILQKN